MSESLRRAICVALTVASLVLGHLPTLAFAGPGALAPAPAAVSAAGSSGDACCPAPPARVDTCCPPGDDRSLEEAPPAGADACCPLDSDQGEAPAGPCCPDGCHDCARPCCSAPLALAPQAGELLAPTPTTLGASFALDGFTSVAPGSVFHPPRA